VNVSRVLELIVKEFIKTYGSTPEVIASTPGRLDFLNTHQDYKGLPVVSVAINKRMYVAVASSREESRVISLNLCLEGLECRDVFSAKNVALREKGFFGNYIRSVVLALRESNFRIGDFNMLIYSEIPVASGLASSAALQVAVLGALNELFGFNLAKHDIAELAYHSEHDIMGIPCGRLDQYGSSMGGITKINTRPPYSTKTYRGFHWLFVVLNSGIKHSTAEVHPRRISEIVGGLKQLLLMPDLPVSIRVYLSERIDSVVWEKLDISELEPYLERVSSVSRKRILFTLKMHKSTELALSLLEEPCSSNMRSVRDFLEVECRECLEYAERSEHELLKLISGIVNYQHILLRDLYDVSLPELELIRNVALRLGALGVKISGAGLGGSLLALVNSRDTGELVAKNARAREAWIVEVDESGVRVNYSARSS